MNLTLLNKTYCSESIVDAQRDLLECLNPDYSEKVKQIPVDKWGFLEGKFTVTVTWNGTD